MENKFEFRLQKVLDMRVKEEDLCKMKLKKSIEHKKEMDMKLKSLEKNYQQHNDFHKEESVVEKKLRLNYLNLISNNISTMKSEITVQSKKVDENRSELLEKQISKKTVEVLKEKKYQDFLTEEKLVEQRNNDELALYAFIRNRKL
ncbi:flagellar FliJ protein [Hathewaya proteolytica DSM 3090]|uniref:Flagellar FliJ protein n=1 Tax=Hathewaya proteolytica DSM 3090 TaxID=1121331 RepID=A0A1M6LAF9_9CLOT|nr:flagellar export protein FliJ [Hathewaya proteolytica]SHJ68153.1 flagellar FliJ protein [Hathewaya proteolytica DSM 3090]